jgi:hypothetical protein
MFRPGILILALLAVAVAAAIVGGDFAFGIVVLYRLLLQIGQFLRVSLASCHDQFFAGQRLSVT